MEPCTILSFGLICHATIRNGIYWMKNQEWLGVIICLKVETKLEKYSLKGIDMIGKWRLWSSTKH